VRDPKCPAPEIISTTDLFFLRPVPWRYYTCFVHGEKAIVAPYSGPCSHGGAIRDRQGGRAFAEEFDKFATTFGFAQHSGTAKRGSSPSLLAQDPAEKHADNK